MFDFKIQDIFIMFIIIYLNNFKSFVWLCFSFYEIMQLFLISLLFMLDFVLDFVCIVVFYQLVFFGLLVVVMIRISLGEI